MKKGIVFALHHCPQFRITHRFVIASHEIINRNEIKNGEAICGDVM